MWFTRRNIITYYVLFTVILCLWLCGSNGVESGFKIFRSERDIFTNLKCTDSCTDSHENYKSQCEMYDAECVSDTCEYCRCLEGKNTFMITKDDERECKSDEEIVPESVPQEAFSLKNDRFHQCLKSSSSSKYMTGTYCDESPTLDMLWIWPNIAGNKQLINVKTLKCMERIRDNSAVTMEQCENTSNSQKILCTKKDAEMNIGWDNRRFLHFYNWWGTSYAISQRLWWWWQQPQPWSSKETSNTCKTSKDYKGCYRFSDGSFMHYLDYSQTNPKLNISAPIFKEHDRKCKVREKFKFIRDGQEWKGNGSDLFYINGINKDTKEFEIKSMENLKVWNGSLLILRVSCKNGESKEVHCVLLKLKSLPQYPEVSPTSSSTDVSHSSYESAPPTQDYTNTREVPFTFPNHSLNSRRPTTLTRTTLTRTTLTRSSQITDDQKMSSKPQSQSPTPITSTTENPQEGFKEEGSESDGTNSAAIAVTVTLLLLALALALGYLVYYRRRKRAQVPQSNNNDLGVVNYSKEIYEDPDRIYETLKEDGHEVPRNQPGTSTDTYSYPDSNIVSNPASTEQEYTYAKDTDFPRSSVGTKPAAKESISNGAVYETLEQPGQPTDDDFYNYPDNTNIANQGLSELEYIYAKDTDLPRPTADTKAVRERNSEPATSGGLYHTLEQEGPASTEQEYSYAKNTDMPSIPLGTEQPSNGHSSPPPNSSLYHTLEEPNPPQAPVYSTLEGPQDVENHK